MQLYSAREKRKTNGSSIFTNKLDFANLHIYTYENQI